MSPIRTVPAYAAAGYRRRHRLGRAKVTVSVARTAGPGGSGSSASRPEGMSIATTGRPARFSSSMASAERPLAGPRVPVPSRASTTTSAERICAAIAVKSSALVISRGAAPIFARISRFTRASPLTSSRRARRNVSTVVPRFRRCRATTQPSPPLFPRPQTMATRMRGRPGKAASISRTASVPAFSMRRSDGIPYSALARRSSSCISFAVTTLITIQPSTGDAHADPVREYERTNGPYKCGIRNTQRVPECGMEQTEFRIPQFACRI